ncbi:hypothetical protein EIN_058000 [Entamoeba invadens IP1]|uniref:hypothetical protein n=1 Tax=Entamoeba invadens IP1 TaxID=370355 RepID=UPI0002C3D992|nr:hypothetical protein EIN_058000 [Entamoeba invadens IP1]ELP93385.1 hypothetical protein EIN_058000 [Entamoeba invadens IP1]|eukprot:XP_004260156.1 hypothetical protein EIN_058000 [Entamoeba invadens IP1]
MAGTIHVTHRLSFPKNVSNILECSLNSALVLLQSSSNVVYIINSKTMEEVAWIDSHKSQVTSACWNNEDVFVSYEDGVVILFNTQTKTSILHVICPHPLHFLCSNGKDIFGASYTSNNQSVVYTVKKSLLTQLFKISGLVTSMIYVNECIMVSSKGTLYLYNLSGKLLKKESISTSPLSLSVQCCSFKRRYAHPYSEIKQVNVVSALSTTGDVYFLQVVGKNKLQFMKKYTLFMNCYDSIAVDPYSSSWDNINFCIATKEFCFNCTTASFEKNELIPFTYPPVISLCHTTKGKLFLSSHRGEVAVYEWADV